MRKRTVIAALVFALLLSGIFRIKVFAAEVEISPELQNAPETEAEAEAEEALLTQEDVVYPIGYPDGGGITDISLFVKPPVAGVEANKSTPQIACSAYTVSDCSGTWQDSKYYATGDPFPFTFEEGKKYYICATLEAMQGYFFKKGTQQGDTGIDANKYDFDGTIAIQGGDASIEYAGIFDYGDKSYMRLWITVSAVADSRTTYTVKFFYYDQSGMHQFGSTQTVTGDTKTVSTPSPGPQVDGWTFTGKWNRAYDGPPVWNFDSPVSDGASKDYKGNYYLNLYADFEPWNTRAAVYDSTSGKEGAGGTVRYVSLMGAGEDSKELKQTWSTGLLYGNGAYQLYEAVPDEGFAFVKWVRVPKGGSAAASANEELPAFTDYQDYGFDHVVKYIPQSDGETVYAVFRSGKENSNGDGSGDTETGEIEIKEPVAVTGITMKSSAEVPAGKSVSLGAKVLPANADNQRITFTSSALKVATVDKDGVVKGIVTGDAVITAVTEDGKKKATCKVHVLFSDVTDKKLANFEAIYSLVDREVIAGFKNGEYFAPNDPCTRAQVVLFMWRAAGKPSPKSTKLTFADAAEIEKLAPQYKQAILWGSEKGFVKGFTSGKNKGKFVPNDPCTRAQIVLFLYRFAGKPAVGSVNVTFTDKATIAALAPDYTKAVNWAFSKKITQGYKVSGGYVFRPNVNCTRGECATFLYRQVK